MGKLLAKERIMFTNYELADREDVLGWFLDCGNEEEDFNDDVYYRWAYDDNQYWLEDVLSELNRFFDGNKILVTGQIGRWNGVSSGFSTFDDFEKAYWFMVEDCDYVKIYDENGHLYVTCSHHDGTNNFELKMLSDDGNDYLERWEYNWSDKRNEKQIGKQLYSRYSKCPHFAHKVYGHKVREYEPQSKERFMTMLGNQAKSYYC